MIIQGKYLNIATSSGTRKKMGVEGLAKEIASHMDNTDVDEIVTAEGYILAFSERKNERGDILDRWNVCLCPMFVDRGYCSHNSEICMSMIAEKQYQWYIRRDRVKNPVRVRELYPGAAIFDDERDIVHEFGDVVEEFDDDDEEFDDEFEVVAWDDDGEDF